MPATHAPSILRALSACLPLAVSTVFMVSGFACAPSVDTEPMLTPAGSGAGPGAETPAAPPRDPSISSAISSTGGKRLKVRYLKASDGATHFLAWHDTQRNEECTFVPVKPGVYRCLPSASVRVDPVVAGYADAACTKALMTPDTPDMAVAPSCATPVYAVATERVDGCDPVTRVLSSVAPYKGALYSKSSGSCVSKGTATSGWYSVGPEVPLTDFVEASVAQEP
jgi:hypothetical protein